MERCSASFGQYSKVNVSRMLMSSPCSHLPFFSDVAEIVGLNRVSLEQAAFCSDGLYYSGPKVGKMRERMQAVCAILNSLVCPDIEKLVP
jgi:hypothetical protein